MENYYVAYDDVKLLVIAYRFKTFELGAAVCVYGSVCSVSVRALLYVPVYACAYILCFVAYYLCGIS
jgi:uncharacterized protein involved in cysteine biosynthesis